MDNVSNSLPPFDDPNLKPTDPLVLKQAANPPPLIFGEDLAAREPKHAEFLTEPDNIGAEILVLYSVSLISNIGLLTSEALTGEPNEKELTFNNEPSTDNDEVTALYLIPYPNGSGYFNAIGGYTFYYAKEGVLVGKIDLGSMSDKRGFGAATEIGVFTPDKGPEVYLVPEFFWMSIFTSL